MVLPEWLEFRPRLFPSCNFAWLAGPRPVLVDSGFGSDLEATLGLLPGEPALVFNTHWHSDHVGGTAALAERFRMLIAASAAEGSRVNDGDLGPVAGLAAEEFAERLVADLEGSGAARWKHDRLVSTVPHSKVLAVGS